MRRHSRTQRPPLEHFEADERPALLPGRPRAYDVAAWSAPKVGRDHYAAGRPRAVLAAAPPRRRTLRARADAQPCASTTGGVLVKTHPRQPPGRPVHRPAGLPGRASVYALRDVDVPADASRRARRRHRRVRGRAARRARCRGRACAASTPCSASPGATAPRASRRRAPWRSPLDMLDVHRLQRMLELGRARPPPAPAPRVRRAGALSPPARRSTPCRSPPVHRSPEETPHDARPDSAPTSRPPCAASSSGGCSTRCPSGSSSRASRRCRTRTSCCCSSATKSPAATASAVTTARPTGPPRPGDAARAWDPTAKVTYDRTLLQRARLAALPRGPRPRRHRRPVGVGKTFLAHALGHIACRRGLTVLAVRADRMLKTLKHARLDNSYEAELRKLLAVDLLILDDFALDAMDATESRDTLRAAHRTVPRRLDHRHLEPRPRRMARHLRRPGARPERASTASPATPTTSSSRASRTARGSSRGSPTTGPRRGDERPAVEMPGPRTAPGAARRPLEISRRREIPTFPPRIMITGTDDEDMAR